MVAFPEARRVVLEQIQSLALLEVDRRYQNPNDTALGVFLLLAMLIDSDYRQITAELVDRAPQCWYAKKLARRILDPPPIASHNVEDPPRRLAIARTLSTDRMTPFDFSRQLGWYWSDRKASAQAVMTKDSLPEVLV